MSDPVALLGDDQPNILDQPIHGIIIPSALFVVGVSIITYMTGDLRYLAGILLFAALLGVRALRAFQRRQSLFPDRWTALELEDQTLISKNTALYRFRLKTKIETLNIPAGHHVAVRVPIDGEQVVRYYNPISSKIEAGYLDLLVKSYPNGVVSKYFASLQTGMTVDFKGPMGIFNYVPNSYKTLSIVCGGSGITPVLQILNEVITVPEDFTKIYVIYANDTEKDILLKEELDEMAEKYPNFEIHYVVRHPKQNWDGESGLITMDQMNRYLPPYSEDNRLIICGPEPMERLVLEHATQLGWKQDGSASFADDQVFVFQCK